MTEVDFYLLSGDDKQAFEHFVVRLAEKSLHSGRQMLLLTASEASSQQLSHQLWHLRPESFLPHYCLGSDNTPSSNEQDQYRLWVHHQCDSSPHSDVLLNLSGELPTQHFSRFSRLIELVPESEEALQNARERYQFFTTRGYPIRTHDLRKRHSAQTG